MITNIELEYLQKLKNGEITKSDNPKRYSDMMKAIRYQIDSRIARAIWLVDNFIEIMTDEKAEIEDETLERYRRFKAFAYITSKLSPQTEMEGIELNEILKKLAQLHPSYYFEATKKKFIRGLKDGSTL